MEFGCERIIYWLCFFLYISNFRHLEIIIFQNQGLFTDQSPAYLHRKDSKKSAYHDCGVVEKYLAQNSNDPP